LSFFASEICVFDKIQAIAFEKNAIAFLYFDKGLYCCQEKKRESLKKFFQEKTQMTQMKTDILK